MNSFVSRSALMLTIQNQNQKEMYCLTFCKECPFVQTVPNIVDQRIIRNIQKMYINDLKIYTAGPFRHTGYIQDENENLK